MKRRALEFSDINSSDAAFSDNGHRSKRVDALHGSWPVLVLALELRVM